MFVWLVGCLVVWLVGRLDPGYGLLGLGGIVIFMYCGELFPTSVRNLGVGVSYLEPRASGQVGGPKTKT